MSRVGKLPVKLPEGIKSNVADGVITLDSGKEQLTYQVMPSVKVVLENGELKFSAKYSKSDSAAVGMDRSNVNNIVLGMKEPFKVKLEINGVGYKVSVNKDLIILSLGYSHEIYYSLPKAVSAVFEKPNFLILSGADKVLVGQVAAEIIAFRKTEPYKGKGVKIAGQRIVRKEGKKK